MSSTPPPATGARRLLGSLPRVLLAGLLVRELLCFWTGHPYDFEVWLRTGHAVAVGMNPYTQPLGPIPGVSIAYYDQALPSAAYPPFWPLLTGGLYRLWIAVGGGNRFVLYFLIKQPTVWGDVGTAYLLHRVVRQRTGDETKALAAATFWAFFPYAIAITAVWGQFDSIVVDLVLASLLVAGPVRRNALYGLGVFVKWLTAIFVPLEIFRERGLRRLTFVAIILVPVLLTALAFQALGWSLSHFIEGGFSQSLGGGYGMNFAYLFSISQVTSRLGGYTEFYTVISWIYVPAEVVVGVFAARWARADRAGELRAFLLVVATFLALRFGLYEQYLLYLFALFAIDLAVDHPRRRAFYYFVMGLVSADLLVNNDGGLRFLVPLNSGLYTYINTLDSSAVYGNLRFYGLLVLAILVTITLAQLLYVLVKDDPAPVPWPVAWVPALRRPRAGTPS